MVFNRMMEKKTHMVDPKELRH